VAVERGVGHQVDAWLDDRLAEALGAQPVLHGGEYLGVVQRELFDVRAIEEGEPHRVHGLCSLRQR
jgi:hypothetical protein